MGGPSSSGPPKQPKNARKGPPFGGLSLATRRHRLLMAAELALLGCAVVVAGATMGASQWDPALLLTLAGFSIIADLLAVETALRVRISGSFLSLVLAMVFL